MKTRINYDQRVSITHVFGTSMEAIDYLHDLAVQCSINFAIKDYYDEDTIEIRVTGTLKNVFNYLTKLFDEDEAYEMLEEYLEDAYVNEQYNLYTETTLNMATTREIEQAVEKQFRGEAYLSTFERASNNLYTAIIAFYSGYDHLRYEKGKDIKNGIHRLFEGLNLEVVSIEFYKGYDEEDFEEENNFDAYVDVRLK